MATAGCASEGGHGSLSVRISGEEAALSGYPVGEGNERIAFADGWTLEFHRILVSLAKFELATTRGDKASDDDDPVVVDLHGGETELGTWTGSQRSAGIRSAIAIRRHQHPSGR
jgi:hypothetical protein